MPLEVHVVRSSIGFHHRRSAVTPRHWVDCHLRPSEADTSRDGSPIPAIRQVVLESRLLAGVEPTPGFEPGTFSLPRKCSTA
jgi:hypothetical protein